MEMASDPGETAAGVEKKPVQTDDDSHVDESVQSNVPTVDKSVKTSDKPSADEIPQDDIEGDTIDRGWRFWAIIAGLSAAGLLSSFEGTVVSTSLPTIVHDLDLREDYAWIVNAYFLSCMVVQPFFGQISDIFGRRWVMISATALFILGSGIAGAANNLSMLIAGRSVQGVGGGGIGVLIELVICDLVPLRERAKYLAIVMMTFSLGTSIGPFIGGIIVQRSTWRWVFYLNLPVGGVALALLIAFLQVEYTKKMTFTDKMKRIDFTGNAILISSLVAILIALTDAGTKASWSSLRIILPLTLGFAGLATFHIYEASRFCVEPTMPSRLFTNRTTVIAFILTFVMTITGVWEIYFLPVYFQAVKGSTPSRSGVQVLPTFMFLLPAAIIGGFITTKFGRYKPLHLIGYALVTLTFGLLSTLTSASPTAAWTIYQAIGAIGSGLVFSSMLSAIQADLADADAASSTATFAFIRSFGAVWGLTIPAAVFNNQINRLLYRITDPAVRALLTGGTAYSHASRKFIYSFQGSTRDEIIGVYTDSLKLVWQVGIPICGICFFLAFLEREIKLRTELKTEYGMKKIEKTTKDGVETAA